MSQPQTSRTRWLLVAWMVVISGIAYLDRINLSIAGPAIAREYHLSNIHLGWVFSAFVVGYGLFQVPGGTLADHWGARRVLTIGLLLWGVFTSLTAFVPPEVSGALFLLIGVRLLLGAGEAAVYPSCIRVIANWIPTQDRGIVSGLILAGAGIGAAITPPLITFIMVRYGWHWSFWASALIGVAAAVVWFLLARDAPERHPWVSSSELALIRAGVDVKPPQAPPGTPWRAILWNKEIAATTMSCFCTGYVSYIFFTWFFVYLTTVRGLDLKAGSIDTMLPFIAMAICAPLGGSISDALTRRYGKRVGRCGIAVVCIAMAGVFVVVGARAASPHVASIVLAGGVGAIYLAQSTFWSVIADVGGPWAGAATGVLNMGPQAGGVFTAILTPAIANRYGWTASFLTAAALCGVGSLLWLFVDPDRKLIHDSRVVGADGTWGSEPSRKNYSPQEE